MSLRVGLSVVVRRPLLRLMLLLFSNILVLLEDRLVLLKYALFGSWPSWRGLPWSSTNIGECASWK